MAATSPDPDTETLLAEYVRGQTSAETLLLMRYRERLRKLIGLRLDRRLTARVDPSDILQETLLQAASTLPKYARTRPLPFYPWLRQIAIEKVIQTHRRHIHALGRTVKMEAPFSEHLAQANLGDWSGLVSPLQLRKGQRIRASVQEKVHEALWQLKQEDRDILVLRFLEELSTEEAAVVLSVSIEAARSRLRRALERFGKIFSGLQEG